MLARGAIWTSRLVPTVRITATTDGRGPRSPEVELGARAAESAYALLHHRAFIKQKGRNVKHMKLALIGLMFCSAALAEQTLNAAKPRVGAPTVAVVSPPNSAVIRGQVTVAAVAVPSGRAHQYRVSALKIFIVQTFPSGDQIATMLASTSSNFVSVIWDTGDLTETGIRVWPPGTYQVQAQAQDFGGDVSSNSVTVTVQ